MDDDDDHHKLPPPTTAEENREKMISSFTAEITSYSRQIATHILEAHQWDIDAAASAFNDALVAAARPNAPNPTRTHQSSNPLRVDDIPAPSPIRLRSPRSPPSRARNPFSREAIQPDDDDDDFDDKENVDPMESDNDDVETETHSVTPPRVIHRTVTIWRNGVTVDGDNTLWTLDNPQTAQLLEKIESSDSPRVHDSPGGTRRSVITLIRRQQEDFSVSFQGVGRTLSEQEDSVLPPASSDSLPTTVATPSIDPTAPTTTIRIILADGTPIVSRFNTTHHTIRNVRDFIDAATPNASSRDYQLLIMVMGSPPTPLANDLDQTIEQAGISNSVLTLKF